MEKAISLHFYANTNLKSKSILWKGKLTEVYPLYARLVYDTRNTQLKAEINGDTILVSEDLDQISNQEIKEATEEYKQFVLNVVKAEIKKFGSDFSFKNLGKRLSIYQEMVNKILGRTRLESITAQTRGLFYTDKNYLLNFFDLLNAVPAITAFDWIHGTGSDNYIENNEVGSLEDRKEFARIVTAVIMVHLNA